MIVREAHRYRPETVQSLDPRPPYCATCEFGAASDGMISILLFIAAQPRDGVRTLGQEPPQQEEPRGDSQTSVPVGTTFRCSVASLTDGDTLRCKDGTRVRIAGIDASEISPCSQGRQCAPGDAAASKRALAAMAPGRTLTCRRVGTSYKRAVAFCSAEGMDLSCAQVRAGHAIQRYSSKDQVCR